MLCYRRRNQQQTDTATITHSLALVRSRGLPRPRTPARTRALPPSSECPRGRGFGLRASRNCETRSRWSRVSQLRSALRPVAPAPPPKSGVRSVLRTQRAFLSATAGTIPRHGHPAAESAVLGWGVSGTSPRLRVRWLPLSPPRVFQYSAAATFSPYGLGTG